MMSPELEEKVVSMGKSFDEDWNCIVITISDSLTSTKQEFASLFRQIKFDLSGTELVM